MPSLTLPFNTSRIQLTVALPFLPLNAVVAVLGVRQDEAMAFLEDGRIWAFDCASRSAGKRCVRVLAASLAELQSGRRVARSEAETFKWVLDCAFPLRAVANQLATIQESLLSRRFAVDHGLISRLTDEGSLLAVKGSVRRCGPGGSQRIIFSSVVEFLRSRRIT